MLEQKTRMIKCYRSELQRSTRKIKQFEKLQEYQKIDIRILKAVESLSSTEEYDVYSRIIIDERRNFGNLKAPR
jgi:precorrin-6x reductase